MKKRLNSVNDYKIGRYFLYIKSILKLCGKKVYIFLLYIQKDFAGFILYINNHY